MNTNKETQENTPVAEIYTAAYSRYNRRAGWSYYVYDKDGNVTDEMYDSATPLSEESVELVAVAQALRANQYLADGENETVLLVVKNDLTCGSLINNTYHRFTEDWVAERLDDLLEKFRNGGNKLVITTPDKSGKHKLSYIAEDKAEEMADESASF